MLNCEYFVVKILNFSDSLRKLNARKYNMHIINGNAVRGRLFA